MAPISNIRATCDIVHKVCGFLSTRLCQISKLLYLIRSLVQNTTYILIWNNEFITLKYSKMMLVIVQSLNGNLWIRAHSFDLTMNIITLNKKNISKTNPTMNWSTNKILTHMLICCKNNGKHKLYLYTHSTGYIFLYLLVLNWTMSITAVDRGNHVVLRKKYILLWRTHHSYHWFWIHPWASYLGLHRVRFPRHRGLAIPTCITARASGSLTSGFLLSQWRGKRSPHSRFLWFLNWDNFNLNAKLVGTEGVWPATWIVGNCISGRGSLVLVSARENCNLSPGV